ncbi:cytochrome P450 [Pilobolus umbonatus]|nr:cytochrome P450 [Pilobolus umbonatus]
MITSAFLQNVQSLSDVLKGIKVDEKHTKTIISITAATAVLFSTYKAFSVPDPFKNKKGFKKIPVPDGAIPYIGHLLSFAKNPSQTITNWHRKYGPIFRVQLGIMHGVFINDPYLAHDLFVTHGSVTSDRPQNNGLSNYHSDFGRGIISAPYGHSWKKTRNAALSILAPKKLDMFADMIDSESDALVERLISCSEKEGGISPMPHLEFNSLNFISAALFGIRFETMDDPKYHEIADIPISIAKLLAVGRDISTFLPAFSFLKVFFTDYALEMRDYVANVRDPTMRKLIKEAHEREGHNLVKAVKEERIDISPEDEIVFFVDLLLGGTDTTATSLSWACAILCHHRDVQDKMYEEIKKFTNKHGRYPTFHERNETPYIFSTMRECMRYRPAFIFIVPHSNTKDVVVDGYFIPKDSMINVCVDNMNRNPMIYSDPEKFIADRFMNNHKSMMAAANGKLEERDQYGFGWGRRICPGIYLAELEMYSAFTRLFSQCIIEAAGELPDLVKPALSNLISQPAPYKAKFTRRT